MSSMLLTGHYYCVSCKEVIPDVALCSKHYFECHSPNILRIRLVAHSMESQRSSNHKGKARNSRRDTPPNISQTRKAAPNNENAPNFPWNTSKAPSASSNIDRIYEAAPNVMNVPYSSWNTSNVRNSPANIRNMCEASQNTTEEYRVARKTGTTHVFENKEVINNNHFKRNT